METIAEALGGMLAGGATGLLGTVAGRLIGLVERRQERLAAGDRRAFEREKWAHDLRLAETAAASEAAGRAAEAALARDAAAAETLKRSVDAEASVRASYPWVDAVRALVRPALTLLLWAVATAIYASLAYGEEGFLADADRSDLARYLAGSVVYCATAATLWWFGDRAPRPASLK